MRVQKRETEETLCTERLNAAPDRRAIAKTHFELPLSFSQALGLFGDHCGLTTSECA